MTDPLEDALAACTRLLIATIADNPNSPGLDWCKRCFGELGRPNLCGEQECRECGAVFDADGKEQP